MNHRTTFDFLAPSPLTGEGRGEGENKGFALVSALAFLLVITLLGVSIFLGVNLQQKAAGNSLEKTRALELAQSVTIAAERWLATTQLSGPENCTGESSAFRVCASPPTEPANPPYSYATPVSITGLQTSGSGGADTYYAEPGVWITYLGRATMGPGSLYRIDTYAYGGNERSIAVTETVFYVGGDMHRSTPAQNLGH
ncbi:MAG: pilus assembly PilX family protein [Gammaproteobacteria bacterium]